MRGGLRCCALALVLGVGSCRAELPPVPQVVVVFDTDLPEHLATRLRVDFFSERGVWFETREFTRASAHDWPASFGVVSPDLAKVIVRARVYPEGHVRDYRGERFGEFATTQRKPDPSTPETPRLIAGGAERTPASEPNPDVTVDRFVALSFESDARPTVFVTLRAACAGTMSQFSPRGDDIDVASVRSCLAEKGSRLPIGGPDGAPHEASLVGSWGAGACSAKDSSATRICVPGGAFVFGDARLDPATTEFPPQERIARVDRFWLDRAEITVGEYRASLARGFAPPEPVTINDDTLAADPTDGCSFTSAPQDRESLALTCVSWRTARAYCNHRGGDLPTEARWEYAAVQAGRRRRAAFPWGDEEPTCDRAAFGRAYLPPAPGACQTAGSGPLPVGSPRGDVTALGIFGLAGGVSEWMQDTSRSLTDACWRDAALENTACLQEGKLRSVRGGSWAAPPPLLQSALRGSMDASTRLARLGFRCAYESP